MKSRIDIVEPSLEQPNTDIADPMRMIERKDKEDPM
jgi:hypothetical protein